MYVLTNDDGIDAPGIDALRNAIDEECIVVAPDSHHSGCSHRVTTFEGPVAVNERASNSYAIGGTPADCTRIALHHLDIKPRFVLSGINAGGNLGWDIYPSGTVAAAREAAYFGVPAIAISQYMNKDLTLDWERSTALAKRVFSQLMARDLEPGSFWNVNLPHLESGADDPDMIFCRPCKEPLPYQYTQEGTGLRYAGEYGKRPRTPGADTDLCFSGNITVSLLTI